MGGIGSCHCRLLQACRARGHTEAEELLAALRGTDVGFSSLQILLQLRPLPLPKYTGSAPGTRYGRRAKQFPKCLRVVFPTLVSMATPTILVNLTGSIPSVLQPCREFRNLEKTHYSAFYLVIFNEFQASPVHLISMSHWISVELFPYSAIMTASRPLRSRREALEHIGSTLPCFFPNPVLSSEVVSQTMPAIRNPASGLRYSSSTDRLSSRRISLTSTAGKKWTSSRCRHVWSVNR